MLLRLEKLELRTRQLANMRFINMKSITPMSAMDGQLTKDEIYTSVPDNVAGSTLNIGDFFMGKDRYMWARKAVSLPPHRDGCEVMGLFDFGISGKGHMRGFESLLYVDRRPYQGVDTNHADVIFEELAGKEVELTFLLWTGFEDKEPPGEFRHEVKKAQIGYLHKATDEFYYLSKTISETLRLLPDTSFEKHALASALDAAYLLINWNEDKFHATVTIALEKLTELLRDIEKHSAVTVNVVGHTHIDVAWLWRIKHTREKAVRSFSTVLKLMDEFDEYVFLQTQPQLYKYIKSDCPELYGKIKARIAENRWEADGGMWVESDCNIPCGESLVRQFIHGIKFFKDEFDKACEYLWLPDVFGYSWALPQILKLCNISTFMTTKISWNQYNTIPHDLFKWRGIDGSEVMTYFVNTPDARYGIDSRYSTYSGVLDPMSVLGSWHKFQDKAISDKTLICYGYGDGGGGVNRDMLKMRRAMDKLPGLPNVKPVSAGSFFRDMHEKLENTTEYVHTWDGELYLEYHRGTYTSQAANKKWNRILENKLLRCEWLCALRYALVGEYPNCELQDAWESLLLHQFHDIIPGSSVREVYEDSDKAYTQLDVSVSTLERQALEALTAPQENSFVIYHGGSFKRSDLILLPINEDGIFHDEKGNHLEAQKSENGWLVKVTSEPLALQTVTFKSGKTRKAENVFAVDTAAGIADTPLYRVKWDDCGRLVELFDKVNDRQVLSGPANVLEVYEDKPLKFDNWDIDIFHKQKREEFELRDRPQVIENGSERCVIRFRYGYNLSAVTQDMILYRDCGRVDFVTTADWHETDRLLKAAFPLNVRSTKAAYDIQFGHVERPTHYNTSWDWARFEVCGHKWADISESDYGVSLMNDCKYGYSAKDSTLCQTLLKSGKYPDAQCDMGEHKFTYALFPHSGSVTEGGTIEESVKLNQPLSVMNGRKTPVVRQLVKSDNINVQIDAVKKADSEECVVVRLHECRGTRGKVRLTSEMSIKSYAICNLLEENIEDQVQGDAIDFEIKPFEIKSVKLWLQATN